MDFKKNEAEIKSQNFILGTSALGCCVVLLLNVSRDVEKNNACDNLGVPTIKFRLAASTPKWGKSDGSLSVDAFGVVRNCHTIRALGDVLFFHNRM